MNTITIGRSLDNTIPISAQYPTVSGHHITIAQTNGQLYLQDHSTNGSYVNGKFVHNQQVAIRPNDTIMLGREYRLDMVTVLRALQNRTPILVECKTSPWQSQPQAEYTEPNNLNSFNWGAFLLNWIWGIGNGVWWGLLCLIPYIGFVVAIVLGVKGNRSAWAKFDGTAKEFECKQAAWSKWGWIIIGLSFVIGIILGIMKI